MMTRTEKEKMLAGDLYNAGAPELQADMVAAHEWLARYNAALGTSISERRETAARTPRCGWRGCRDSAAVSLRLRRQHHSRCRRVPELQLRYPRRRGGHHWRQNADRSRGSDPHGRSPTRCAAGRASGLEFGRPIHIGRNVWVGGGAIILPGVTVSDDALIGAGSVVTRDMPAGATAFGNPARVRA